MLISFSFSFFAAAGLSLIKNRFIGMLIMGSFLTQESPGHNSIPRVYLGHPMSLLMLSI